MWRKIKNERQIFIVPERLVLRTVNRSWGIERCVWIYLELVCVVGRSSKRRENWILPEKRFPVDWKINSKIPLQRNPLETLSKQGMAPSTAIDDIFSKIRNSCLASSLKEKEETSAFVQS